MWTVLANVHQRIISNLHKKICGRCGGGGGGGQSTNSCVTSARYSFDFTITVSFTLQFKINKKSGIIWDVDLLQRRHFTILQFDSASIKLAVTRTTRTLCEQFLISSWQSILGIITKVRSCPRNEKCLVYVLNCSCVFVRGRGLFD